MLSSATQQKISQETWLSLRMNEWLGRVCHSYSCKTSNTTINNIELKEKQISNFRADSEHLSIKLMIQEITTAKNKP